ncbi:hypothetical protein KP77_25000 [Jeotgalibacillus alimentarius]|uniref:Uncharacterized protein n=1 Tax=Jeotgalibacillus alimentarius TaxID=135826 RepID=A0A0C2VR56_9BACL|nr:hypothetical protein [Jeotgalibacillus alimentarius]KIL46931.1 hypothetical protein KP77_25000 [Jeotgalibacillus alimentarius]
MLKEWMQQRANGDNFVLLGDKKAEVKKISPDLFKKLTQSIDVLPNLLIQVFTANQDDRVTTGLLAAEVGLDEVVRIVSLLSDIDEDYLHKKAGVSELVRYLMLTYKRNDFEAVLKNVKSLLHKNLTDSNQEIKQKA